MAELKRCHFYIDYLEESSEKKSSVIQKGKVQLNQRRSRNLPS